MPKQTWSRIKVFDDYFFDDEPDRAKCLKMIKDILTDVKVEYAEVQRVLKRY